MPVRQKKTAKKTIARKLIIRASLLLAVALVILFTGSFHTVRRIIIDSNERYAQAVLTMYCDMIAYEAERLGKPVDEELTDVIDAFSRYVCQWYRIYYIYIYKLDLVNNTYRLITFDSKWQGSDTVSSTPLAAVSLPYTPNQKELELLDGKVNFIVMDDEEFLELVDIRMLLQDSFGNKLIAGTAVSSEQMLNEANQHFMTIGIMIFVLFAGLIMTIYFFIVRKVSRPAQKLSRAMTDFITDGQRTKVYLEENSQDEFGMIAKAFNSMTREIDSYLKDIRSLNEERADQESQLQTASNIQQGFLPPERLITRDLEIRALMAPAKDVGGDLYDYLPLDHDRLLFVVADVSGKGMPASLFMSVTLMLIRQYARTGLSPAMILESVNNTLSVQNPRMLFATAFVGIYNSSTKRLIYANAGHHPPYILHDTIRVPECDCNTVLGLFEGETFTEHEMTLRTGDVLFLFTDGVDEATDPSNQFFGTDRLEKTLLEAKAAHEENLVQYVSDELTAFAAGAEQHDDITLLTLTVKDTVELKLDADQREFSKIRETILHCSLPRQLQLDLCVAAEEIFVNICSYAFAGKPKEGQKIFFTLEHSDRITMRFADSGVPYDPRESVVSADDYDMDLQIGGLGKLIAFTVADLVDYEYKDGRNLLTITKYIKEENENDH